MTLQLYTASAGLSVFQRPHIKFCLSSFPLELLNEIAQYSLSSELLALCRTSKQFHHTAIRLLYRVVLLARPVQVVQFCRAILVRPLAALAVRRFSIDLPIRYLCHSFFKLVVTALTRLVHLEALDISSAPPLLVLLGPTSFPCLTHCSLPYSKQLVSFLRSHPSLRNLIIHPPTRFVFSPILSDEPPCVVLPNLESYIGPSKVAQFVVPFSKVYLLTIFWDLDPPPDVVVPSFALSKRNVSVLDNIVVKWDPAQFTAIATCLPGVVMLRIRNAAPSGAGVQPFLDHVESLLPKFKRLIHLGISHIYNVPVEVDDLDKEHDRVTRWGQIVPTLQVCTLCSGTKWSRFRPDAWFPDRGGANAEAKAQWLFRAILAVKYPLDMYADIQQEEGKVLVSKLEELRDRGVRYPMLVLGQTSDTVNFETDIDSDANNGLREDALWIEELFLNAGHDSDNELESVVA